MFTIIDNSNTNYNNSNTIIVGSKTIIKGVWGYYSRVYNLQPTNKT